MKGFLLKPGTKQACPLLLFLFTIELEVVVREISLERKRKGIQGAEAVAQGQSYVCRTLALIPSTMSKNRLC